ncbi:MAG: hypothetical protein L6Q55_07200 [Azonexus sp.]|nr:DUF3226 domain-containing protein [Azonexus sp.]MCK6412196.1 hypothetical protein [Azonexus sp.]
MRKYGYLVVEGPHDVEFCYRLLSGGNRASGLQRVQSLADLDKELKVLVPDKFPHKGDLQKRVPVPLFLQSKTHSIAIHSAVGDSNLVDRLEETVAMLNKFPFTGLGIMLDSDSQETSAKRYSQLRERVKKTSMGLSFPVSPGAVASGPPRCGAFVLPDNASQGTLEDLLLESAAVQYANLLPVAKNYVDAAIRENLIPQNHRQDIDKPAGRNKAVIGAMATLFKPGKAIQTSIQDNAWLRAEALSIPKIKAVQQFLADLFDLPIEHSSES